MLKLMVRTVFIYFVIVFSMRLMGKKQLGELQPSELVSTILISNLASICIESPEIPLAGSVVPVLLIVCLEILLSALCLVSRSFSVLLSGSPKILIRHGVIDQHMLRQLRFTMDDLLEALRAKDIFSPEDVELALVETNGSISICRRSGPKPEELSAEQQKGLPTLPIFVLGQTDVAALEFVGMQQSELERLLAAQNCPANEILAIFSDGRGSCRIIRKEPSARR